MISRELAEKLKNAGMVWEPKKGDIFVADFGNGLGVTAPGVVVNNNFGKPSSDHIWLPRLDRLLA